LKIGRENSSFIKVAKITNKYTYISDHISLTSF